MVPRLIRLTVPAAAAVALVGTALPAAAMNGVVTSDPRGAWGVALTFAGTTKKTTVHSVLRTKDRIYLGGDFDRLAANDGTSTTPAVDLAALHPDGTPDDSFNAAGVKTNGLVRRVTFMPDASGLGAGSLYIGGTFTKVTVGAVSSTRNRIARFTVTPGAPPVLDAWAPSLSGSQPGWKETDPTTHDGVVVTRPAVVYAIAVGPDPAAPTEVYVGGTFAMANGASRDDAAAFDIGTGDVDPTWTPTADNGNSATTTSPDSSGDIHGPSVRQILVYRDDDPSDNFGDRVYLGGEFDAVNGNNSYKGVAAVDPTDGSLITTFRVKTFSDTNDAFDLALSTWSGDRALLMAGAGYSNDLKVLWPNRQDGARTYISTDGDVQTLAVIGDYVYIGGHFRDVGGDGVLNESRTARARLSTGSLDTGWKPQLTRLQSGYYYGVWSVATYHDDGTGTDIVYMGGVFKDAKASLSAPTEVHKKFTWFEG